MLRSISWKTGESSGIHSGLRSAALFVANVMLWGHSSLQTSLVLKRKNGVDHSCLLWWFPGLFDSVFHVPSLVSGRERYFIQASGPHAPSSPRTPPTAQALPPFPTVPALMASFSEPSKTRAVHRASSMTHSNKAHAQVILECVCVCVCVCVCGFSFCFGFVVLCFWHCPYSWICLHQDFRKRER